MDSSLLKAGVDRVDITPPVGQRMQGILRRIEPSRGIESPLLATALVIESGATKIAILDCDLIGFDVPRSDALRHRIGEAIGVPATNVLLGTTHTHSGPITFVTDSGIGIAQWGSELDDDAEAVNAVLRRLADQLVAVTVSAARQCEPVRYGSECGHAEVAINREERLETGRTILGRNPSGAHDHNVEVLRLDRLDGTPLAILTGYAAHPVVMGWTADQLSPDYPGVVRKTVEKVVGGTCLFLTGAAGNQATIEFLQDDWTEMRRMGTVVGCAAAQAAAMIDTRPHRVVRDFDASLSSLALYKKVFDESPAPPPILKAAGRKVTIPYGPAPTAEQLRARIAESEAVVARLRTENVAAGRIYAALVGQNWARVELEKLESGRRSKSISFDIVGFRIGDFAVVGMPGEPFVEIGLAVKALSRARHTLFAGYSTGAVCYWPDRATVRDGTAMSVTSAIMSHGISAPPCEDNHDILIAEFSALVAEIGF